MWPIPLRADRWDAGVFPGGSNAALREPIHPLKWKEIWATRNRLQLADRARELALFNLAIDSAGNTVSASRTVVVVDPSAPLCTTVNASPAAHVSAGRAVRGGFFTLRALSNGDRQDIGFGWDYFSTVALYEGQQGRWYARIPAACRR